jgi:lactoylglutathione lyase
VTVWDLDHVLILANDVPRMRSFLLTAADLAEGVRPKFPFAGHWLYSGDRPLIHLASAEDDRTKGYVGPHRKSAAGAVDHVALSGSGYDALVARLQRHHLDYFERRVPESGEHQVFVPGPEGVKLEFVFRQS